MGTRRNIRATSYSTAATARNTKKIINETQRQTAIILQVEAERALQQARHEATLQAAEQARQRQVQRELDFRYATDPAYRGWVDEQRAELERQRLLTAQASAMKRLMAAQQWAADAPARAERAMVLAKVEQQRKLRHRHLYRIQLACIVGTLLTIVTIGAPLGGSIASVVVIALWLFWRRWCTQDEHIKDASALDEAQRTAALAALTADDTEWVNRQMQLS